MLLEVLFGFEYLLLLKCCRDFYFISFFIFIENIYNVHIIYIVWYMYIYTLHKGGGHKFI